MTDRWPFPADTSLERARKIAQSYRRALQSVDASTCDRLDAKSVEVGQGWVIPTQREYDLDDLMPATDVAVLIGVDAGTVRQWGVRGHIERLQSDGKPVYRIGDVIDYCAQTRRDRVNGRKSA